MNEFDLMALRKLVSEMSEEERGQLKELLFNETKTENDSNPNIVPLGQINFDYLAPEALHEKKVMIYDLHNYLHRFYHTGGNIGERMLKQIEDDLFQEYVVAPDFIIFAADNIEGSPKSLRKSIYAEYKSGREERTKEQIDAFKEAESLLRERGFQVIQDETLEADDTIGFYAKLFAKSGANVTVMSTDKDMVQLLDIDENILLYNPQKKSFVTKQTVLEKYGVSTDKILDLFSLTGDTSDGIQGAKGVGVKKAASLIQQYGSLEEILNNADNITGKLGENIRNGKEDILTAKKLIQLYGIKDLTIDVQKFALKK